MKQYKLLLSIGIFFSIFTIVLYLTNHFFYEDSLGIADNFPEDLSETTIIYLLPGGTVPLKVSFQTDRGLFYFVQKNAGREAYPPTYHVQSEYWANIAYKILGVPTPETQLYQRGKKVPLGSKIIIHEDTTLLNQFIQGHPKGATLNLFWLQASEEEKEIVKKRLQKHFVVDCLLGAWDSLGYPVGENIVVTPEAIPVRVDNGSALSHRALGGLKTEKQWNRYVTEIDILRWRKNTFFFHGINEKEIVRQIDEIIKRKEKLLDAMPDCYREILSARIDELQIRKISFEKKNSSEKRAFVNP